MLNNAAGRAPTVVIVGGGVIIAGKEIMMLNLARGLRSAGYRPVFVTSVWGGKDAFVSRLKAENFEYFRVRSGFISKTLSWKPILWTIIQLAYWPSLLIGYWRAIKTAAPIAVIHTNWHHALLLLPLLDRRRDIYWSHEIIGGARHFHWIFNAIAKRVARIVCVSRAVSRAMERVGVPTTKLTVVHNGVSFAETVPPPRTELPLRLGIVGQIGPWKGHDDALAALAQLPRESAVLKIFGSGQHDYVTALKRKAEALGISDRIEWCGFVSNPEDIFAGVDICLMPSRVEESFGMAAIEANSFGRPVICTPLGGLSEIVFNKITGFHVPERNPDSLASSIKEFVQHPKSVMSMGSAARERAESEFSARRFMEDFIAVIAAIAGHASGNAGALC
jgi:glycosyltransferase involved in cell wall biosynthesis